MLCPEEAAGDENSKEIRIVEQAARSAVLGLEGPSHAGKE